MAFFYILYLILLKVLSNNEYLTFHNSYITSKLKILKIFIYWALILVIYYSTKKWKFLKLKKNLIFLKIFNYSINFFK